MIDRFRHLVALVLSSHIVYNVGCSMDDQASKITILNAISEESANLVLLPSHVLPPDICTDTS